jgi:hypothetical protein
MKRLLLAVGASMFIAPALAHHGWSSFDQDQPQYLEGTIKSVRWSNPHAMAVIEVAADMKAPADLADREAPKQTHAIDGAAVLKKARAPSAPAGEWQLEFAPLFRMQAWGLGEAPKVGDRIEVVGYTSPNVARGRLMRIEYVFYGGKVAALRSSPAN